MRKILFSSLAIFILCGTALAAPINGECSNLDEYYTSTPRSSSLNNEDLCDEGNPTTVTYNSSLKKWGYKCTSKNGGSSDSCIVDLAQDDKTNCRIVATDKSWVVPFSTSVLCSGTPSGKTAIVISKNGKIFDAIDSDSEDLEFDDSGVYTLACYPDVVNNRDNVCKTTIIVSWECGNGIEESDEQCDDGNVTSGDGCSNLCQYESEDGSVCGNGIKEAKEQCDDGNTLDGDDCTSICQNTTPRTGPLSVILSLLSISLAGAGFYFYQKKKNMV